MTGRWGDVEGLRTRYPRLMTKLSQPTDFSLSIDKTLELLGTMPDEAQITTLRVVGHTLRALEVDFDELLEQTEARVQSLLDKANSLREAIALIAAELQSKDRALVEVEGRARQLRWLGGHLRNIDDELEKPTLVIVPESMAQTQTATSTNAPR